MAEWMALSDLLHGVRAPRRPFAIGAAAVDLAQLRGEVAGIAALLADYRGQRVGLYHSDTRMFTAWLFGAWHAGCIVVLPGDDTATTTALLGARCALLLGELRGATHVSLPPASDAELACLSPTAIVAEVFTSGSTGVPVAIPKTLAQFEREIAALETVFGAMVPDNALIVGSVSHQHLYGLLFRVLWPLASGRTIHAATIRFPEGLWAVPAAQPLMLVGSPAFLKRLPEHLPWSALNGRFAAVFSSGGALPASAAIHTRELLGVPVHEIYGSSETGGIATRCEPDGVWQPLPGVEVRVSAEGLLQLCSPFLPDADWYDLADRVELADAGMRLLGRADRIVKIEEKRISLSQLESELLATGLVAEARVLPLTGARIEIGAAVVLNALGQSELEIRGHFGLNQYLRERLSLSIERIGLPRRWRYIAALPTGTMGKVSERDALELFNQAPRLPLILSAARESGRIELELELMPELTCFDGHFEQVAILPGVAQIDWAIHFARQHLALTGDFAGMDTIKFQQVMRAGARVTLELIDHPARHAFAFRYHSQGKAHSSGRIRLAAPP